MLKKLLSYLLCALLIFAFSGIAAAEGGPVELRLSFWFTAEDLPFWQDAFDSFEAENPNVKVTLESTEWGNYWTKFKTQIASGSQADVFGMVSMYSDYYIENKALAPLDGFIADTAFDIDDFWKAMIEAYTVDGQLYCLPYDMSTNFLVVNRTLMEKFGVEYKTDYTLDEFLEICKQMTNQEVYAISPYATDWVYYDMMLAMGAEVQDENGRIKLNTPEVIQATQWLADLNLVHGVANPFSTGSALGLFESEKVVMQVSSGPQQMLNYWPRMPEGTVIDILNFPADKPAVARNVEGGSFAMSSVTQHPQEAWALLSHMVSEDALRKAVAESHRGIPGRESQSDTMLKSEYAVEHSYMYFEPLKIGRWVNYPGRTDCEVEMKIQLERVFMGEATAEEALNAFQEEADFIMDEY